MRFVLGVLVGAAVGRYTFPTTTEYLTPTVRRKIADALFALSSRIDVGTEQEDN